MPANLPPTYHEAEERYRRARDVQDKIAALEEMLRIMPKHKGTDKLQADLKARLAKLRRQPRKKGGGRVASHVIPREGAGQIALVGPPNTGKSALVRTLTHATPEVAEYPFTTREALPGMMPFEDVAFQLVDLPPLSDEYVEPWVFDLVRRADLVWVVVDVGGSLDGVSLCRRILDDKHIRIYPAGTPAPELDPGWTRHRGLLVVTGLDRPGSSESLDILRELLDETWPVVAVSPVSGDGLERLKRRTFEAMEIIRVYTKQPGKPADREQPFTLERDATVGDLARLIHKDLAEQMKFARIWGPSAFDGQTVQRDHALAEGDVVELHV